ncbi:MAG: M1 family aminopeptidase, partial [Bacteroidota bacterium]
VFEKYFGPYPFWNDGYALVETPYLGMEHQGAIAYGNQFKKGYLGSIPEGLEFDFIILHETGHEWFGNSLSCKDHAEMWLHEAFTTYMESIYVEEMHDYEKALYYVNYYGRYVTHKDPMVGPLGVNYDDFDTDIYYKGALMLNTLRHCISNDDIWWDLLKEFYQKYQIQPVETQDFIDMANDCSDYDYNSFFEQYLHFTALPNFQYEIKSKGKNHTIIRYRWDVDVEDFQMPVIVFGEEKAVKLNGTTEWQETILKHIPKKEFKVAEAQFYITTEKMN